MRSSGNGTFPETWSDGAVTWPDDMVRVRTDRVAELDAETPSPL